MYCSIFHRSIVACDCRFESVIRRKVCQYGNYRQFSKFDRGRIWGLREGGFSYREIANRLNQHQSAIVRCYQAWSSEGHEPRRRGTVKRWRTNGLQDWHLSLMATRNRFYHRRSIAGQCLANAGRPVILPTIYRKIRVFSLHSYQPHFVWQLTAQQRQIATSLERRVAQGSL